MSEKEKNTINAEKQNNSEEEKERVHKHHHEEHKKKKKHEDLIPEELKKEIDEKDARIKELENRILYLQADFENFKKLKAKEKADTLKYGNETLIRELLPVIDHLEMALKHAESTEDYKSIYEGVKITLNEFSKVLEKTGVKPIEAVGQKFDPNFHEAFYQEDHEDVEPGTVISELQKGYILNDRLVRPSRVGVSKKPEIQ